jgi:hypothetical protein
MEIIHQRRQIRRRKIIRPHAGVEAIQAKVYGIGAILDRRPSALPVPRRRE